MRTKTLALFLALMGIPTFVLGEVTKVNVASRASVANGQAFGKTGPYEKLTGTIEFAVDPREPHNARITDIDRAMPGADKRVHFTSDLMVLKPVDPSKGNGVLLFEVVNRGNILLLNKMNSAASSRSEYAGGFRQWLPDARGLYVGVVGMGIRSCARNIARRSAEGRRLDRHDHHALHPRRERK